MTDKLLKLTPSTERIIDMHYYECYGEGSIEKVETGSVVVYIVRGA